MKPVWLCLLAACGGSSASTGDAGSDGTQDAGNCFGAAMVTTCLPALPTKPRALSAPFDTDGNDCFFDKGWCVIAGTDVEITTSRVRGDRPLVIVATGSIYVDGVLDVSSRRFDFGATDLGAAANSSACVPPQGASQDGGGPGGTFGGRGGNGGVGTLNSAEAGLVVSVTAFRGGCPGMVGAGDIPGGAGASGGAVYLIARKSILITGTINASGAPGSGAVAGGGGGGGSGGMVGLEAPLVSVIGSVFANGGGGGEGGPDGASGANPATATNAAAGGNGGTGGDGGEGAAGTNKFGARGNDAATGGGGGGGGAGVIVVIPTQVTGGVLSPAPS